MRQDWYTAWQNRADSGSVPRLARTRDALDLAPLVDIVLLLVIFALMVNGFVYQPGVQIDMPAITKPDALKGHVLTLTVTAQEQVFVGDPSRPSEEQARPVALREALASMIGDFGHRHPDGIVLIKADANTRHGYLLQLMELVRDAGIRQIAFGGVPQQP